MKDPYITLACEIAKLAGEHIMVDDAGYPCVSVRGVTQIRKFLERNFITKVPPCEMTLGDQE